MLKLELSWPSIFSSRLYDGGPKQITKIDVCFLERKHHCWRFCDFGAVSRSIQSKRSGETCSDIRAVWRKKVDAYWMKPDCNLPGEHVRIFPRCQLVSVWLLRSKSISQAHVFPQFSRDPGVQEFINGRVSTSLWRPGRDHIIAPSNRRYALESIGHGLRWSYIQRAPCVGLPVLQCLTLAGPSTRKPEILPPKIQQNGPFHGQY